MRTGLARLVDGEMQARPLDRIRVLDVSHIIAGPFATMLLAHAGAEVIKIEPPVVGERSRASGRPIHANSEEPISLQYVRVNRSKKGVTLNLRDEAGRALFRQLVSVSDVLVENFRPGAMKKLGLDYDSLKQVNPQLIYATISGFGRRDDMRGPYSDWPANNPSAQAMSGIMDVTGEPDSPPGLVGASIGDTIPGLWTAYGILLALEQRRHTGEGRHVDIAMYDCLVMHNDVALPFYDFNGKVASRQREDMWSPQLRLEAEDGYVVLSGSVPPSSWAGLWRLVGREDLIEDPRYLGNDIDGPFMMSVIRPVLENWTRGQKKQGLCRLLLNLGFSAGVVQTAREVYDCEHLKARNMFQEFDFVGRHFRQPGNPAKLSDVPDHAGAAPPRLGQHNQDVFQDLLGLSEAEMRDLNARGVM
jgi:crotonobetainyl-CoA:carnitine CoA-transferase CaiB-like acyl-CoA transferase